MVARLLNWKPRAPSAQVVAAVEVAVEEEVANGEWRGLAVECRKARIMANPTITIPLDPQTARAYESAAPEQKCKM